MILIEKAEVLCTQLHPDMRVFALLIGRISLLLDMISTLLLSQFHPFVLLIKCQPSTDGFYLDICMFFLSYVIAFLLIRSLCPLRSATCS